MLNRIFEEEKVKTFLRNLSTLNRFQNKEIPNTISEEKIDDRYYSLLVGMDAVIKYCIIVDDINQFDEYLIDVERLLRKVYNYNDIKVGVNRLIINAVAKKMKIINTKDIENKKIIFNYIYDRYIVNGYFFHSFPSSNLNIVSSDGLLLSDYKKDTVFEIDKLLSKYNIKANFIKDDTPSIVFTDSPFMGLFYAYNSPLFLDEVTSNLFENGKYYDRLAFFMKDCDKVKKNISFLARKKDMFASDKNKLQQFVDYYWDYFDINNSFPVFCLIRRNELSKNTLKDYEALLNNLENEEIDSSITKLLDTRFNNIKICENISPLSISILELPKIDELGIRKKESNSEKNKVNDYGNVTIIALLGVFLIALGLLVTIIMIGGRR